MYFSINKQQSIFIHFSSCLNPAGLPGQCKDITYSDVTKNSCKISWEAPEDDGGTPIISYTLERREASKKTYMPVTSGENILTHNVKDLYINCEYYFRVKAVNEVGAGEYLELRNPVITEEVKRKSSFQFREDFLFFMIRISAYQHK